MTGARIVLSTWGSLGDLHPYLALGVELQRRGHRVAVATLPSWRDHVERTGATFHAVGPDVPGEEAAAREMIRRILDDGDGPRYLFEQILGPATRESYDGLLAAVRADGGADMLVSHVIPLTAPLVAGTTGVKWVSGVVQPLGFLSVFDPPTPAQAPWLRPLLALHPSIARLGTRIARVITNRWMRPIYELRAELGLGAGRNPVFEGQHSPRLVLALFSPSLGGKQPDYPPQTLVTGFPFYDGGADLPVSRQLLEFLDSGEPPVVFTLGSSAVWIAEDFYEASIEAARAIGRRALLLAGGDSQRLRDRGLPSGIAAFDYAPHSVVMPRAAVIVHQGGVGTTGQALRAGRPMLVVPFGQDQPDNARRCVRLGVARIITRRQYTPSRIARELSQLLGDPDCAARAREVGAIIQGEQGTSVACDALEAVLRGD